MADPLSEFRDALERLAERTFAGLVSTQGIEPTPPAQLAHNPLGTTTDLAVEDTFGTGYDGSQTTVPAMFNISTFNGGDQFVGS